MNRMKKEYSDIGGIQQQAADIIRQAYDKGYKRGYMDGNINNALKHKPKTGRWIDGTDCSCCGFVFYDDVIDSKILVGFKYFPKCGARMVKPQESEDKE